MMGVVERAGLAAVSHIGCRIIYPDRSDTAPGSIRKPDTLALPVSTRPMCGIAPRRRGVMGKSPGTDDRQIPLGFGGLYASPGDHIGHFYQTTDE